MSTHTHTHANTCAQEFAMMFDGIPPLGSVRYTHIDVFGPFASRPPKRGSDASDAAFTEIERCQTDGRTFDPFERE